MFNFLKSSVSLLLFLDASLAVASTQTRLYSMNCGSFSKSNFARFSDTGSFDGEEREMSDGCFLVSHGADYLVFDTGVSDAVAGHADGVESGPFHRRVYRKTKLINQLELIGLSPEKIQFVAFSHLHSDHSGNANLFSKSTWLLNRKELEFAEQEPPAPGYDKDTFNLNRDVKKTFVTGDFDVFGDGNVKLIQTPGHTPGHMSLLIHLKKSGWVIVTGDVYHTQKTMIEHLVPTANSSRAETLASEYRIDELKKNLSATIVISHDGKSLDSLPVFPNFLD